MQITAHVCNFFQHFVGTGRIGEKFGMTLHEFGRVLHLCRLLNYRSGDSRELCKKIFFTFVRNRVEQKDAGEEHRDTKKNLALNVVGGHSSIE